MVSNTTGDANTAVGRQALEEVTTGGSNVAVGAYAAHGITTCTNNISIGKNTLYNGNTSNNTAVGHSVLGWSAGLRNTSVGANSSENMTTGADNTAIGSQALQVVTTGDDNTGLGQGAGKNLTTGSNNIFIGYDSGTTASPAHQTTGSNIVVMGNNSITHTYVKVDWTVTSDRRDKTDITPFNHGLSWINKLEPVTYRWDNRSFYDDGKPDGSKKQSQLNLGLIAQDEIEVEKEHGYGDTPDNMLVSHLGEDGNYGMQYSKLVPVLVNAVKELSAENNALKARLDAAGL